MSYIKLYIGQCAYKLYIQMQMMLNKSHNRNNLSSNICFFKIRFIVCLTTICFFSILSFGKNVLDLHNSVLTDKNVDTRPKIYATTVGDTLIIRMDFNYVEIDEQPDGDIVFRYDGFGINQSYNERRWPVYNVNVPSNCLNYNISILEHEYIDLPYVIARVQDDHAESTLSNSNKSFDIPSDSGLSFNDKFLPELPFDHQCIQCYRGKYFLPLRLIPVQYNEATKKSRLSTTITYQIIFGDEDSNFQSKKTIIETPHLNIAKYDNIYELITYADFLQEDSIIKNKMNNIDIGEILDYPSESAYLILTHRNFLSAAQRFADWKRLLGYDVSIKYPSGLNKWTPETIKKTISQFAQENPNFYNILILGDHTKVPPEEFEHYESELYGTFVSDFRYSCLDGVDDLIPDVAIGRIPCSTLQEANAVIDKIIDYERYPSDNNDFYKNAFVAAEYEDMQGNLYPTLGVEERMFVYTSEVVRESLMSSYGFDIERIYGADPRHRPKYWSTTYVDKNFREMPMDLTRPYFQWNGKSSDVCNVVDGYSTAINGVEPGLRPDNLVCKYANFSNGQYEEREYLPLGQNDYTIEYISDNEFEIRYNGAYVEKKKLDDDYELWEIYGTHFGKTSKLGDPLLPKMLIKLNNQTPDIAAKFKLVDSSFVDFEGVECCPVYADADYIDKVSWKPIIPYSGFKPFEMYYIYKDQFIGGFVLNVYPILYNYEDKIMRCYRYLKFKLVDDSDGVSDILLPDENVKYFSIDGKVIDTPQRGCLYIKRVGGRYLKIIY